MTLDTCGLRFIIVAFALCSTMESIQSLHTPTGGLVFLGFKLAFYAWFTLEVFFRIVAHQPIWRFWNSPIILLCLLTVIPFWLRVFTAPHSLTPSAYFERSDQLRTLRALEALATLR